MSDNRQGDTQRGQTDTACDLRRTPPGHVAGVTIYPDGETWSQPSGSEVRAGMPVTVARAGAVLGGTEVEAIEVLRRVVQVAATGDRVGLPLAGVDASAVRPGDLVTA